MRNLKLSGSHVCSEFDKLIRSGTKYILSALTLITYLSQLRVNGHYKFRLIEEKDARRKKCKRNQKQGEDEKEEKKSM
jgi:hypothetical protein